MNVINKDSGLFQQKLERRQRIQNRARVLVVDDEPSIVELLDTALSELDGYEVTKATSASEALRAIRAADTPFDLLLLDIQMPGKNGVELLRDVRALAEYEDTPVIMLTAMCDRKYVDDAFSEGATDYVTKPFDFIELRSRMRAAEALVTERAKARRSQQSARALQDELDTNTQFGFDDPLSIKRVDRHLRYVEFDNYVAQLSRGRLFNSQAVAVKLFDARFLYDASTSSHFRQVVTDLAKAIEACIQSQDCMFSYRGSGLFLVVEHGRKPLEQFLDEQRLDQLFNNILKKRQSPTKQRALVGLPVFMRSLTKSRAMAALSDARDSVEGREAAMFSGLDREDGTLEIRDFEQKSHLRRRVYERVLVELFHDESYLNIRPR